MYDCGFGVSRFEERRQWYQCAYLGCHMLATVLFFSRRVGTYESET
jgi:hypothetical protein